MSLIVVEDGLHALDTGVLLGRVIPLHSSLVPVKDTTDERRDQVGTGLGRSDGLDDGEHEGEVAVDAMLRLEFTSGLDTFPGGSDLDQDAVLGDAHLLV